MSANLWKVGTVNAFNTTLNGNIGSTDTSMTLNNTTGLQSPGVLVVDRVNASGTSTPTVREYVSFTGISGASVTSMTRALGGSTAQSHSSGAIVEEVFSITHWNDMITALLNVLTSAGALDTTKVVDASSSQTLSNKTLASPILTGTETSPKIQGAASNAQFPAVIGEFSNGNSGTSLTIDWSKGDRQLVTMTGNCTFTYSNATQGQTLTLRIVEDATGGRTITLPTSKWPGGTVGTFTTTASAINLLIIYFDGTNYLTQLAAGFA